MTGSAYHHGDLRRALLDAAREAVQECGANAMSLREVARRAGVSHAAPAHHFADKAGLLTALAQEGFERFRDALIRARDRAGKDPRAQLLATGRAYVRFALENRADFEVMFRPQQLRRNDPGLVAASSAAYAVLADVASAGRAGAKAPRVEPRILAIRSWALAHGLATLWLEGNLDPKELEKSLDAILEGA